MNNNNNNNNSGSVTISRRTLILIIIAIILLLLTIITAVVLASNWNRWFGKEPVDTTDATEATDDSSSSGWKPDLDGDADDYKPQNPIPDAGGSSTGIKIPGYPRIPMQANDAKAYVALLNPEGNPCYFCFEIVLKDTGESLYKSKMVPPGKAINGMTLSRTLEKGQHSAVIKITTFSLTDGSSMNGANVETTIDVQ